MPRVRTVALAVLLTGCSATSTHFDWDPAFDFAGATTWAWARDASRGYPDRLVAQRIEAAVTAAMRERGFMPVESDADVLVAWQARRADRLRTSESVNPDLSGVHEPQFDHWTMGPAGTGAVDVDYYEEGTLILDVIDPATDKVVWRGTAMRVLDRSPSPERANRVVRDAVDALLGSFPPR